MVSRRRFCVLLAGVAAQLVDCCKNAFATPAKLASSDPTNDDSWSFLSPPDSARPYVLWMWMGCNVSKPGITKDLQAMKDAGLGRATIFSLADSTIPWAAAIGKSPTSEIVAFTDPWWEMVRHAASEAQRLGLELILHNCAGYESSGGPWITPELSMQEVVWSKTDVRGNTHFKGLLKKPTVDLHPHAQFPQVYMPDLGRVDIPIVKARETYYKIMMDRSTL